jgi:hypothetical protein
MFYGMEEAGWLIFNKDEENHVTEPGKLVNTLRYGELIVTTQNFEDLQNIYILSIIF